MWGSVRGGTGKNNCNIWSKLIFFKKKGNSQLNLKKNLSLKKKVLPVAGEFSVLIYLWRYVYLLVFVFCVCQLYLFGSHVGGL